MKRDILTNLERDVLTNWDIANQEMTVQVIDCNTDAILFEKSIYCSSNKSGSSRQLDEKSLVDDAAEYCVNNGVINVRWSDNQGYLDKCIQEHRLILVARS